MSDMQWRKVEDEDAQTFAAIVWKYAPGLTICNYTDGDTLFVTARVISGLAIIKVDVIGGGVTFLVSKKSGVDLPIRQKSRELLDEAIKAQEEQEEPHQNSVAATYLPRECTEGGRTVTEW
jgi:hypothetical protein